jgi:hypothetical protein
MKKIWIERLFKVFLHLTSRGRSFFNRCILNPGFFFLLSTGKHVQECENDPGGILCCGIDTGEASPYHTHKAGLLHFVQ